MLVSDLNSIGLLQRSSSRFKKFSLGCLVVRSSFIWKKRKISWNDHSLHSLSLVVPLVIILYHSLSLFVIRCHSFYRSLSLVAIRCHSLPFVVTRCTTRRHLLYHSLSLVVSRCTTRCQLLSFVVTRCTTRCHSLSLDVPVVCLFINDHVKRIL